ncbi:hypothetical protein GW17_00048973 [Ensete ventricosum]|nr:hypothetical protein GW17_00048973 [Ensete ventricosum]
MEMDEVNMFGDERDNEEVEEERELSTKEAADEKESLSLGNNKEESNRYQVVKSLSYMIGLRDRIIEVLDIIHDGYMRMDMLSYLTWLRRFRSMRLVYK